MRKLTELEASYAPGTRTLEEWRMLALCGMSKLEHVEGALTTARARVALLTRNAESGGFTNLELACGYGTLMIRDHRYGCGVTAGVLAPGEESLIECLTDNPGSLPFILQPILTADDVPVMFSRGNTVAEALVNLDRKLSGDWFKANPGSWIVSELCAAAEIDDSFSVGISPELAAQPWFNAHCRHSG